MELKTALDELGEKFKDCIPNSDLVTATSRCNDIISCKEWLQFFEGTSNITLEEGNNVKMFYNQRTSLAYFKAFAG